MHLLHPTAMEESDLLGSVILRIQRSRALNDFIEARDPGLVEVVAGEAVVEAAVDVLQTLAELISIMPSLEL
jgi:hypothetical protein